MMCSLVKNENKGLAVVRFGRKYLVLKEDRQALVIPSRPFNFG